jgi:hypothetical protein
LLPRLVLSATLLLLAGLLAAALPLATLARAGIVLLLLIRIPLVRIIPLPFSSRVDVLIQPPRINVEA